jgi:class 3 adenylate cyclase/tetratricopeptide (TPR) repeat protein
VQDERAGTATILYTDVVGSTEMRVRLGDVEADIVRRRHDETLRSAVSKHGGTVVKGLGDGILAAFGASADAARAAHDIQRDIDRANRQAREDRRVGVRVGISAGDVSWEDGDCHGTPVVTAARLCDAADGGQILCDDLVRGLARGHTELGFSLVGEIELKGLPEPVVAYELPWVATASASSPLPSPLRHQAGELPFAARTEERTRLAEAWKRAQVDRATTVLLAGEPGIGKTRIASELARQAHDEGAMVVLGRCDEHLAAAHAPWTELLRQVVGNVGDDVIVDHVARHGGEVVRLVPDLARRAPDAPPPTQTDPDTERLLLFDAVVHLLESASAVQPLVVLLDDAHWADAGSVHLLRHVVTHVDPDTHLLVMVTYRDTDVDRGHPLSGALADLHRATGTERMALRGLDESGLRAFLEAAGGQPLAEEGIALAQRLAEETDGNPFFVTEVLRHLVETGAIVQADGQWVGTTAPAETGLPEGVRDVIGQRLSRLPHETNDLLRTAAVVGREFDVDLVAEVTGVDEDAAVDVLDQAVTARLVDEVEGHLGRLSFAHALVRQTLLEELTTNKRVRLHRRIAELLDARRGTPIEQLAHHYLEAAAAGVASRAIEVACEAARVAAGRMAWEDALRLYERALEVVDLLDDDDPGLRAEILSAMAHVHHGSGAIEAARRYALSASDLARSAHDAARLALAGIAYQGELNVWARPSDPVGVEIIREGLADLPADRPDVRARALATLAHALILAPGGALTEADEAVAAARAVDDAKALGSALVVRAWAVRGVLGADERLEAAEEALEVAVAHGDQVDEFNSLYQLGNAHLNRADLVAARATFAAAGEFPGALEDWAIADFDGSHALARGRFAEAAERSEDAYRRGTALGDTNDFIHAYQRWSLALATGDLDEALTWQERIATTVAGVVVPAAPCTALAAGDETAAREALVGWIDDIDPLVPPVMRYVAVHHLSVLAFRLDSLSGMEHLADYSERFPGELLGSDAGLVGAADAVRGRFAAVQGDLDRAVTLLEVGHALHEGLELHAFCVESGIDLARVLLRRDGSGDRESAHQLLGRAAELAEQLGMAPAHAEAQALLA